MTTTNIASGNEMIDIERNDLDNEINKYDDSSKDHKNKNTSNNDDDSIIIIDDSSDNINEQMYPSDCYSFLSIYGPTKNPGTFDLLKFVSCTNYYSFAHTSLFCILVQFLFPRSFSEFKYSIFLLWISYLSVSTCVPDFVCVECTPQKFLVKGWYW